MGKYVEGQTIEQYGSLYLVEQVYDASDEEMKEHDLNHKKRVTLRKISGENGPLRQDFAIPE